MLILFGSHAGLMLLNVLAVKCCMSIAVYSSARKCIQKIPHCVETCMLHSVPLQSLPSARASPRGVRFEVSFLADTGTLLTASGFVNDDVATSTLRVL